MAEITALQKRAGEHERRLSEARAQQFVGVVDRSPVDASAAARERAKQEERKQRGGQWAWGQDPPTLPHPSWSMMP
ncbi:MAG: hypothetical protein WAL63_00965 [Solirubrobacteraceae bacterium]